MTSEEQNISCSLINNFLEILLPDLYPSGMLIRLPSSQPCLSHLACGPQGTIQILLLSMPAMMWEKLENLELIFVNQAL